MRARLVAFGEVEIDGRRYAHDVILEGGRVRKRRKGPSKPLRGRYGHTPLTAAEDLPWAGHRLVVGTGHDGLLPIAADVYAEAGRRGIEILALPTAEACRVLEATPALETCAVLHVTC